MDGIGASFISHVWPLCFHGSSWERLPDPRPSQTTWRDRTCVLGAHCETCNTDTETKTSPRGPGRCLERPHPRHSTLVAESHHWYLDPWQTLQISAIQLFWKVSSLWEGFINRHISFVCGMTWHDFTQLVQLIHAICYIIGVCDQPSAHLLRSNSLRTPLSILAWHEISDTSCNVQWSALECNGLMHLPSKRMQKTVWIIDRDKSNDALVVV